MKVSFENQDKVNGLMTIIVEESDYKEKVEKSLKDYRKQANIPGFRKGMAPMGLIKKQYGEYLKLDTINKVVICSMCTVFVRQVVIHFLGDVHIFITFSCIICYVSMISFFNIWCPIPVEFVCV